MNWYYSKNNRQEGPVSDESIRSKISMGELTGTDLAWSEGMADWLPLSKIAEFQDTFSPRTAQAGPPPAPEPVETPAYTAPAPTYAQQPVQIMGVKPARGLALSAMIIGILALVTTYNCACFNIPFALTAIIMGHIAHSRAKKLPTEAKAKTQAIIGWVTGYVSIPLGIIAAVIGFTKVLNMSPEEMRSHNYNDQQIQQMEQVQEQWKQLMKGQVPQNTPPAENR